MLLNPRVAALRVHQGKVLWPGDWPALLDVDTFHGLAAFLGDPSRASGSTFERKHQGSGIYRCGRCGGAAGRSA